MFGVQLQLPYSGCLVTNKQNKKSHYVPEDHNLVTHSCEDLKFHKHTWCNATRFRCRSSMQHILNKDAISHVATDVEPETGEVMTPECYYIYLGLLTT